MVTPLTADVERLYSELERLTAEIAGHKSAAGELLDRRNVLFAALLDAGEKQAEIARRAKVTPTAVAFAVEKPYGRKARQ